MDCEATRELLFDHVDGRLDPESTAAVEAELERCPQCRQDHRDILAMAAASAAWRDEPVPPEVRQVLPERVPRRLGAREPANDPWRWGPAAVTAALAVVVMLDIGGGGEPTPAFVHQDGPLDAPLSVAAGGAVAMPAATGSAPATGVTADSTNVGEASVLYLLIRQELERQQQLADQAFARLLQLQLSQEQRLNALANDVRALSLAGGTVAESTEDALAVESPAAGSPAPEPRDDARDPRPSITLPLSDSASAATGSRGFEL